MYLIRKGKEYFFPIIDESVQKEALELLSSKEKMYFLEMGKYDRYHSLEVYRKIKETSLKEKEIYLKMALLHDCGKEKIGIRVECCINWALRQNWEIMRRKDMKN